MKVLKRKRGDDPANYDWLGHGMIETTSKMWRSYTLLPTPKEQAYRFVLYRERVKNIGDELRRLNKCRIHDEVCD